VGDAGQASGGILLLVENPNKVRARSESNIPVLRFTHDLLLADRTNDKPSLNEAWEALDGYFAHCRVKGQFSGEEYSTIYWRWIVIPIWICGRIAEKRGVAHIAAQVDQWLQDFILLNTLSALPSTKYFGSKWSSSRDKQLFGVPCASIMGARSWVFNEGDDGKRGWDDSMSWVDATSHAPWLAWVLGRGTLAQLTGGDGWVRKVTQGVVKIYGDRPVLDANSSLELNTALTHGSYPSNLIDVMEYGPTKPMVIGRMTNGTWCVGEGSYHEGSTSFMHVKILPFGSLSYRYYSIAHPLKRSNKDPGVAYISDDFKRCELVAYDGTVFDWDSKSEVPGSLKVDLLDGDPVWV
jgi:hypothetical protein